MTPAQLKSSILQLAIQGKLVPQIPAEGTGEELYQQIQKEKQALIKSGKIKKEKPLPPIAEDEIPFEIPEGWRWVRVRDCISNRAGLAYNKSNLGIQTHKMIRVLRGGNIMEMSYSIKPDDIMIAEQFVKPDLYLKRNTIITPAVTSLEHVGKMGRIENDYNNMVVGGFVLMLLPYFNNDTFSQYLLITFSSNYFRDCCRGIVNKSGQAFYNLSREKLMGLIIPLPPLAEQRRIVAKIEELMPLIDRYDKAWTQLEAIQKKFPGDLKKSILQMAIQGKLVPQIPAEGTGEELYQQIQKEKQALIKSGKIKKEKPLLPIAEDEIPFEIPEGWRWCRLVEIASMCLGKMLDKQKNKGIPCQYLRNVNVRWGDFDLSDLLEMKFEDTNDARYIIQKLDLIMCEGGEPGRCAVWNSNDIIHFQKALHRIRFFKSINPFFYYFLFFLYANSGFLNFYFTGTTIKHLTGQALERIPIPLPPLAEQRRIVAKIEELMPLCDRLKKPVGLQGL